MALTTTTDASTITITGTGENLTHDKIKAAINGLNDSSNSCTSKTFILNKKLVLLGDQSLNLGNNVTYQFTGTNRFLSIIGNFTSVKSGRIIEGKRVGAVHLTHFNNNTDQQQVIMNNTVETHLVLTISQNNSNYPRMLINNTHADSTLIMTMTSIDATTPHIYFRGGWVGDNEVTVENCSYQPINANWFNIVEANAVEPFKTLPSGVAYPAQGYNYAGERARFGSIGTDAYIDGLVEAIGIGTSNYTFHPAFSNRKINIRYDFHFMFTGQSLTGGNVALISSGAQFQTLALTGNAFSLNKVVLLKGDTRGGAGGNGGYSQLMHETINRTTGVILIRKAGIVELKFPYAKVVGKGDFSFSGIVQADKNWSNTAVVSSVATTNQLYDEVENLKAATLTLPSDLLNGAGDRLTVKHSWSLVRAQSIGAAVVIDVANKQIKVKTSANGLLKTAKFSTFAGTVDSSFDGHTNALYVKSTSKVSVSLAVTAESGVTNTVWGVWPASQGLTSRANLQTASGGTAIDATAGTQMYVVADGVNAYRSEPVLFTVGAYGSSLTTTLSRIKSGSTNILPTALTTAQQRIADMMVYHQGDSRVDITLPSNYAADSRWDSTNEIWTFTRDDFIPIAVKIEQIQSSVPMLVTPTTIRVNQGEFVLKAASTLQFRQASANATAKINMNAFTLRREGDDEMKNTFIDNSNGEITSNAGSPIAVNVEVPDGLEVDANLTKVAGAPVTSVGLSSEQTAQLAALYANSATKADFEAMLELMVEG